MTVKKHKKQNKSETHYSELLKKQKERRMHFETDAGISIDPLYTNLKDNDYLEKIGISWYVSLYTRDTQRYV